MNMQIVLVIKFVPVPTPIRHMSEVIDLINNGHKEFFTVCDYRFLSRNGTLEKERHVATGLPKFSENVGSWYVPSVSYFERDGIVRTLSDKLWLSDRNVETGGYNNHNLFASEEEADLYIRHIKKGGKHEPMAPRKICNV